LLVSEKHQQLKSELNWLFLARQAMVVRRDFFDTLDRAARGNASHFTGTIGKDRA